MLPSIWAMAIFSLYSAFVACISSWMCAFLPTPVVSRFFWALCRLRTAWCLSARFWCFSISISRSFVALCSAFRFLFFNASLTQSSDALYFESCSCVFGEQRFRRLSGIGLFWEISLLILLFWELFNVLLLSFFRVLEASLPWLER